MITPYARYFLKNVSSEVERRAFLLGQSRGRRSATCKHHGDIRRNRCRQVDMDAKQPGRRLTRHRAGNRRTPVASLGDVPGVAEAFHQFVQVRAMRSGSPALPFGLPEKP